MRNFHFMSGRLSFTSLLLIAWLCFSVWMTAACKRPEPIQQEGLYGRWDITRAEKNGRETSYLRNGYFIINPDGNMTVNLTGEDEHGKYMLDNQKLVMEGEKVFDIQLLQNDSLTVKYVVGGGTQFLIYMMKKKEDAQ